MSGECEKCGEHCLDCRCCKWIKVEDKLPPNGVYVLICIYDHRPKVQMQFILIAERMNTRWYDGHNGHEIEKKLSIVTHWMPLPDPPKEK